MKQRIRLDKGAILAIVYSYPRYVEKFKSSISRKTYKEISEKYSKFLIEKVLNNDIVHLPEHLGTLQMSGRKQKITFKKDGKITGLAPNWKETKALWKKDPKAEKEGKVIYHTNDHTDTIRYKYFWSKAELKLENKEMYSLVISKENRKKAKTKIMEGMEYTLREKPYNV